MARTVARARARAAASTSAAEADPALGDTHAHGDRADGDVVIPATPTAMPTSDVDTTLWWSCTLDVWWRDFDDLGHMTAAAYPAAYEEGIGRFLTERWETPSPFYVVAKLEVAYLHEITKDRLPLNLRVLPVHVGRSAFVVNMVLHDDGGQVCSTAQTRYVAWDKQARRGRPLSDLERAALLPEDPER